MFISYHFRISKWLDVRSLVIWHIVPIEIVSKRSTFRHHLLANEISRSLLTLRLQESFLVLKITLFISFLDHRYPNLSLTRYSRIFHIFCPKTELLLFPWIRLPQLHWYLVWNPCVWCIFHDIFVFFSSQSRIGSYYNIQSGPQMIKDSALKLKISGSLGSWQRLKRQRDKNRRWFQAFFCLCYSSYTIHHRFSSTRTNDLKNCI